MTIVEEVMALRAENEKLKRENDGIHKMRRPLFDAVPQMYGEALIAGLIKVGDCEGHEWDNRTTEENAVWLIRRLTEALFQAECRETLATDDLRATQEREVRLTGDLLPVPKLVEAARSAWEVATSPRLQGTIEHGMNCGAYPGGEDPCTCGFRERVFLQTEQEMCAAWRKRAEQAEKERDTAKQDGVLEGLRFALRHCGVCLGHPAGWAGEKKRWCQACAPIRAEIEREMSR